MLEALNFLTENEGSFIADSINSGRDLCTKAFILGGQVEIRDFHDGHAVTATLAR
jgi:hypothetical protein